MSRISYRRFMAAALVIAALVLSGCAAPRSADRLDLIQADVKTLAAQMERLSAQIDAMDRVVRPLEMRRVSMDFADAPTMGNSEARVGIVAFSDFQCPYCQRFHLSAYPVLKERYIDTGKVLMAYRDLPLAFHPMAKGAAAAAHCAGAQGQYWEAVDALFEAQDRLGPALYPEIAAGLGLDMDVFRTCLDDPAIMAHVEGDAAVAAALGIEGTPTFFIGRVEGRRVIDAIPMIGLPPYETMAGVIESLL